MALSKELGINAGGWHAIIFDEATERVGYWYGTRAECEALDPREVTLRPMQLNDGPDQFDLACERRHD